MKVLTIFNSSPGSSHENVKYVQKFLRGTYTTTRYLQQVLSKPSVSQTYIYMYIYIYRYIYTHIQIHKYIYIYIYMYVFVLTPRKFPGAYYTLQQYQIEVPLGYLWFLISCMCIEREAHYKDCQLTPSCSLTNLSHMQLYMCQELLASAPYAWHHHEHQQVKDRSTEIRIHAQMLVMHSVRTKCVMAHPRYIKDIASFWKSPLELILGATPFEP